MTVKELLEKNARIRREREERALKEKEKEKNNVNKTLEGKKVNRNNDKLKKESGKGQKKVEETTNFEEKPNRLYMVVDDISE